MTDLNEHAVNLDNAAAALRAMADALDAVAGPGTAAETGDEMQYPDPEQTGMMKHARLELARWTGAAEFASTEGLVIDKSNYRMASDLLCYENRVGSKTFGADTMGMTGYQVRPSSLGYWPLDDGGAGVKPKPGEPEHDELVLRLANAQACYDAAQALKTEEHRENLQLFLEDADVAGFSAYVATWLAFWTTIVNSWGRSKYAPEPWMVGGYKAPEETPPAAE